MSDKYTGDTLSGELDTRPVATMSQLVDLLAKVQYAYDDEPFDRIQVSISIGGGMSEKKRALSREMLRRVNGVSVAE